MAQEVRIALDAMGGDHAPAEIVQGAVNAVRHQEGLRITLVGIEDQVRAALDAAKKEGEELPGWRERIDIRNATEVIGTAEHPVEAVRRKKDSSIVVALQMVRKGEADAFASSGNSGAVLVGAQGIIGRIRGVQRPPFATLMPTKTGVLCLLDAGANVDSRPEHLCQWARLGTIYMQSVLGTQNPKVGIVNIGAESEKGNELVKSTYPLLEEMGKRGEINFTGSLEARDIPAGNVDIAICDGFVGNVILKMYEGSAKVLLSEIKGALLSSILSRIGALLIKPSLRSTLKKFDGSRYGGAPMLGLKGLVVKMHGSAGAVEVERAMEQCVQYYRQEIAEKITAYAAEEKVRQDLQRKQEKAAAETEKSE